MSLEDLNQGEKFHISVDVKNTGNYDGMEIVQLYIHDNVASMMRPLRELKAFKKVIIMESEKTRLDFEIGYDDLGYYLPDGTYTVEPGKIDIYIGANCQTKNCVLLQVVR